MIVAKSLPSWRKLMVHLGDKRFTRMRTDCNLPLWINFWEWLYQLPSWSIWCKCVLENKLITKNITQCFVKKEDLKMLRCCKKSNFGKMWGIATQASLVVCELFKKQRNFVQFEKCGKLQLIPQLILSQKISKHCRLLADSECTVKHGREQSWVLGREDGRGHPARITGKLPGCLCSITSQESQDARFAWLDCLTPGCLLWQEGHVSHDH